MIMKNLDLLPISEESKKRFTTFAGMYRRNAKIAIEIVSFENNRLIVRVEQKEMMNDKHLSK